MKNKVKLIISLSLAIVSLMPIAAQKTSDTDFELITENRELPPFEGINVSGRFKIVLYQHDVQTVSATVPEKFVETVETKVENNILYINMLDLTKEKEGNILENLKIKYNDYLLRQPIEIKIGIPDLKSIYAKGATRIESQGALIINNLTIELSGASKAELNANIANSLNTSLSEATKIDIHGKVENISVKANGASSFNGSKLIAKNAKLDLNGAARAEVHATESFDANLNGATKAVCTGSPKSVKQVVSRGSSMTIK
ncbi:MAG: DUF2807 domain-containing protein [Porphyromonadaceae bacterium]|jgi:hypothetical protein|nr:DUF2807 domain-containing protein [Porphyromonadaceae bacterium]